MKIKLLLSLFMGSALSLSAQGYLDGVEYYRADEFSAAKTIFERTMDDASTDKATVHYYLGQIALKEATSNSEKLDAAKVNEAKKHFEDGIAANPNNKYNYVGLAAIDLLNGDKKSADKNIKLGFDKKDVQLIVDIARTYYDADAVAYNNDVQKYMKTAYKADSKHPAYFIFIGDTLAMTAGSDNVKVGTAAGYYENAIMYDPNSAVAYVKYSGLYEGVNPKFSVAKMEEYLKVNPNSALALREVADRYYDDGRWTLANDAYAKCIKNPSHLIEDEERYAVLLMSGEKYEEACKMAEGVIGKVEKPNTAYRVLMHSNNSLKNYAEAAKWANELMKSKGVEKIIEKDHITYGNILENLAQADSVNAEANLNAAIAQYKEALAIDNKCIDAYKALSNLYRSINDYANAVGCFDQFVATGEAKAGDYHNYAGLLLNYANRLVDTDSVAAVETYDRAVAAGAEAVKRSENPYAQYRVAQIYFSKNKGVINADVAHAYEKVVEMLDKDPSNITSDPATYKEALAMIGDFYRKENNYEKAIAAYERYLIVNPSNQKVVDLVAKMKEILANPESK